MNLNSFVVTLCLTVIIGSPCWAVLYKVTQSELSYLAYPVVFVILAYLVAKDEYLNM